MTEIVPTPIEALKQEAERLRQARDAARKDGDEEMAKAFGDYALGFDKAVEILERGPRWFDVC